ncbi:RagB/SusD family nutrient uptake outer membrane protein [Hymenobacter seoulensis]
MKYLIRTLTAAALLGIAPLTSCNDQLDIDPRNTVLTGNALQTSADVEAAMVGVYDALGSQTLYGGQLQFMGEMLADDGDIAFVGTYNEPNEAYRKAILRNNAFVSQSWLAGYRTINTANSVLAAIEKVSEAKRGRIQGEALFVRGLVYFDLVRYYAKAWNDGNPQTNPGVPLVLTPTSTLDASAQIARNSVAEVYAQVLKDLEQARTLLPNSNGVFASKNAASAILSRVYLQQGRYADAATAATEVIASGRYRLDESVEAVFTNTSASPEIIFALQVSNQDGSNDLNTYFSEQSRADVEVQDQHLDRYDANDTRLDLFGSSGGTNYLLKYDDPYANVVLIRLAEMYLTRAEARFRTGDAPGALADLNLIRTRSGLAPLTAAQLTLPAILAERRLELAFEGFRLHDAKRNQEAVINTAPNVDVNLAWNSPRLIFPIPQREIDVNPKLVQNEGY